MVETTETNKDLKLFFFKHIIIIYRKWGTPKWLALSIGFGAA